MRPRVVPLAESEVDQRIRTEMAECERVMPFAEERFAGIEPAAGSATRAAEHISA